MHHFHCCGKNKMSMYIGVIKYELCNSGNSQHEIHVLIPMFKTGVAQYEDEWKMSC